MDWGCDYTTVELRITRFYVCFGDEMRGLASCKGLGGMGEYDVQGCWCDCLIWYEVDFLILFLKSKISFAGMSVFSALAVKPRWVCPIPIRSNHPKPHPPLNSSKDPAPGTSPH